MAVLLGDVVVDAAGDDDSRLDFGDDGIVYGGMKTGCRLSPASYRPCKRLPGRDLDVVILVLRSSCGSDNKDKSVSHRFGDHLTHVISDIGASLY